MGFDLSAKGAARLPRPVRFVLMAAAVLALLAALWAGLIRLGWSWPALAPRLPSSHGPLMICGFMGTLIGLERAVGMGKRWALAAPALSALGTLLILLPIPIFVGALTITLGSMVLVVALAQLLRIQWALFIVTIVLGGLLWFAGNLVWLAGRSIPQAVLWWIGFMVITIAGERLELSRMLRLSPTVRAAFVAATAIMIAGMALGLFSYALGVRLLGVGLLAMAIWLLRYDIAGRRIHAGGQARFTAICLMAGYVWLAFAGLLAIARGTAMAGPVYDALLHSIFVGFSFSMIFGHAPIIFPAVLQIPMQYTPRFYSHLILLHASLLLRVAGDLIPYWPARLWGGLLSALVILLFLFNTVTSVKLPQRKTGAGREPIPDNPR